MLRRTRLKAFTLLESLVALLVISGTVLVYQGLTQSISQNIYYLSDNEENEWLLFSQQLRSELERCHLDCVSDNKLYVSKDDKKLAYGLSKADDFRKTNASGQGYQPMLFGVNSSSIHQDGNNILIKLRMDNGMEREFVYTFDAAS